MSRYVKTSTALIGAILGALVVGGVVAGIGAATNGFKKNDLNDVFGIKYDYVKVDLTNNYKTAHTVATSELLTTLNYNLKNDLFKTATATTTVYQDFGALQIGNENTGGDLSFTFAEDKKYDHVAITAFAYYTENYLDAENGITEIRYDSNGNKIVQSYDVDLTKIAIEDGQTQALPDNASNKKKLPGAKTLTFESEYKKPSFTIKATNGRLLIKSIEFWNTKDSKEAPKTSADANI